MVSEAPQDSIDCGTLPKEWKVATADSICLKITKGTTPPKADVVISGGIPFLRVNNLTFSGPLNEASEIVFISEESHRGLLARSIAYSGDVVMNIVGPPLGKMALLPDRFPEYNLNQAIVIYRTRPATVDRRFFLAYLGSDLAQQWLRSRSKKTSGQQNLTIEICKHLPVPLPPLAEQETIANLLSTWDLAIKTVEKLIENSKAQNRALMQQLLSGKHRLPGFHHPWSQKALKAVGPFRKGRGLSRGHIATEGEPCVLYGDLYTKYHNVVRVFTSFIPSESSGESELIKNGDLLFTASGETPEEIGKCVAYLGDQVAYAGGDILIQSPKSDDPEYLGYLLNHASVVKQRTRFAQGHSVVHISAASLGSIRLILPEREEQRAIAKILSGADRAVKSCVQQRDRLLSQKEAIVQQILTGKRRVQVQNATEPAAVIGCLP